MIPDTLPFRAEKYIEKSSVNLALAEYFPYFLFLAIIEYTIGVSLPEFMSRTAHTIDISGHLCSGIHFVPVQIHTF